VNPPFFIEGTIRLVEQVLLRYGVIQPSAAEVPEGSAAAAHLPNAEEHQQTNAA